MATLRGAVGRLRTARVRVAHGLHNLVPPRWTALRELHAKLPPPPHAFASFGENSWFAPPATLRRPERVVVGNDAVMMEGARIWVLDENEGGKPDARVVLGDGLRLTRFNTIICGVGVTLGANVCGSDFVTIVDTWPDDESGTVPEGRLPAPGPIVIGDGAYLSASCTILPGVTVGEGAYVGEGAVVAEDVPAHSKVYGNPATVTRRWNGVSWDGPEWP